MKRVAPSEALLEDIESSVHCDRCKGIASYIIRHRRICGSGVNIEPPYENSMCKPCLDHFAALVNSGRVECLACHQTMDRMTHTVLELERL